MLSLFLRKYSNIILPNEAQIQLRQSKANQVYLKCASTTPMPQGQNPACLIHRSHQDAICRIDHTITAKLGIN